MLYTPLSSNVLSLFRKTVSRLRWEHESENCINAKSRQKELLRYYNRTDYTHSGAVYGNWNLQHRCAKCAFAVYAPTLEALFAIMCSTACILDDIFTFSPCFRHNLAKQWTPHSEATSHKYGRLTNTACKICRIHVAMTSPFWIHSNH